MKIAKLILGLLAAAGLLSLGWGNNPDAFQQWLVTGILTVVALEMVAKDVLEFFGVDD